MELTRHGAHGWDAPRGGPAATVVRVDDASQIGEARRAAEALAGRVGLDASAHGTVALVVTEMATNLARHAREGHLVLRAVGVPGPMPADPDGVALEALALDRGPGIASVGRALVDGFSTAGTRGEGLGAIRRLAGTFDVYSRVGEDAAAGTALLARVGSARASASRAGARDADAPTDAVPEAVPRAVRGFETGVVCAALHGERACGDAWLVQPRAHGALVVVVDGLGHGPEAAEAAEEAVRVVRGAPEASPGELLHAAHAALRTTRGAALAVTAIDRERRTVVFAGIGNVAGAIHTPDGQARSLASHNGTVGHALRRAQEFAYDWPADASLVLHTDGINTRWRLDAYPGLLGSHPALVAGVLWRDAARGRDDATVLVVREAAA